MKAHFLERQFLTPQLEEIYTKAFTAAGYELEFHDWTTSQQVIDGAKDAECVFSMAIPLTRQVIEALPLLKFIGRCGVGYDSVDLDAATERGVVVCNVADYCVHEVASQGFTLMMALQRQLVPFMARAREGGFGPGQGHPVYRLQGQTLGVVGFGRIGRALTKMALGMSMRVIVSDPFLKDTGIPEVDILPWEQVLRQSDVLALAGMPLNKDTYHMLGMEQFKQMKPTAFLINTSRGALVDLDDLVTAIKTGVIRGAGLDVFEKEPCPTDHELFHMDNVIITPHVSLYSLQALDDMHDKLSRQAVDVLQGRKTRNIVNPAVLEKLSLA